MPDQPQSHASHLPLVALACTVVLAVALPIAAASAGPPDPSAAGQRGSADSGTAASDAKRPAGGTGSAGGVKGGPGAEGAAAPRPASSCGSEPASPGGFRAQACVLSGARQTWARAYYRNGTGVALRGALVLSRPDGTSVRADCAVAASSTPGVCETPRERTRAESGGQRYAAVAEFGSADGERLLLRVDSDSQAE